METSTDAFALSYRDIPKVRSPREERTRVREHFVNAILAVGRAPIQHLTSEQRLSRARLLSALIRYAAVGRFPTNIRPGTFAPTFVDHLGVRCAMAHLIEETGGHELVNDVVATNNHGYVRELAHDSRFAAWLEKYGFTAEEAARIQPSYCMTPAEQCVCSVSTEGTWAVGTVQVVDGAKHVVIEQIIHTDANCPSEPQAGTVLDSACSVNVGQSVIVTSTRNDVAPGNLALVNVSGDHVFMMYPMADLDTIYTSVCDSYVEAPEKLDVAVFQSILQGETCETALDEADEHWSGVECHNVAMGCSLDLVSPADMSIFYALAIGVGLATGRFVQKRLRSN